MNDFWLMVLALKYMRPLIDVLAAHLAESGSAAGLWAWDAVAAVAVAVLTWARASMVASGKG